MSKTLLLADDSVTMQKVVGITFANEDVELVTVDNGDDALNRAREIRPDLVLADVGMPGLDGYSLCAALKSEPALAHVKVILLTGTFDMYDEARAAEVGADAHVSKPFEAQALVEQVRQLLARPTSPAKRAPAAGPAAPPPRAALAADEDLSDPSRGDFDLDFGDLDFEAAGTGAVDAAYAPPAPAASPAAASAARSGARPPAATDDERRFGQTMLLEETEESELVEGEMVEEAWPPGGPPPLPVQPAARGGAPAPAQATALLGGTTRPDAAASLSRARGAPGAPASTSPAPTPPSSAERDPRVSSAPSAARPPRRPELDSPGVPPELGDELWEIGGPGPGTSSAASSAARRSRPAPDAPIASPTWAEPLDEGTQSPRSAARRSAAPPACTPAAAARPEPSLADREAIRETLEKVAWDAFGNLSEQIVREVVSKVEQIAWEVIPVLSERLIRDEIARLKGEPH
jgi:CheY-like chemotaxis protein